MLLCWVQGGVRRGGGVCQSGMLPIKVKTQAGHSNRILQLAGQANLLAEWCWSWAGQYSWWPASAVSLSPLLWSLITLPASFTSPSTYTPIAIHSLCPLMTFTNNGIKACSLVDSIKIPTVTPIFRYNLFGCTWPYLLNLCPSHSLSCLTYLHILIPWLLWHLIFRIKLQMFTNSSTLHVLCINYTYIYLKYEHSHPDIRWY